MSLRHTLGRDFPLQPRRFGRAALFVSLAAMRERIAWCAGRWAVLVILGVAAAQAQTTTSSIPAIESAIRSQRYDEALQLTHAALQNQRTDFRIWTLQGIAYSLKDDSADALKAFDRALSLSPRYVPALKAKVQILYRAQDRRALPTLEQLLKTDPHDPTAHERSAISLPAGMRSSVIPARWNFMAIVCRIRTRPRKRSPLFSSSLQRFQNKPTQNTI